MTSSILGLNEDGSVLMIIGTTAEVVVVVPRDSTPAADTEDVVVVVTEIEVDGGMFCTRGLTMAAGGAAGGTGGATG